MIHANSSLCDVFFQIPVTLVYTRVSYSSAIFYLDNSNKKDDFLDSLSMRRLITMSLYSINKSWIELVEITYYYEWFWSMNYSIP